MAGIIAVMCSYEPGLGLSLVLLDPKEGSACCSGSVPMLFFLKYLHWCRTGLLNGSPLAEMSLDTLPTSQESQ